MAQAHTGTKAKQTNPKQLLVVAALVAVLATVGVVQFSGLLGGGEPPKQQSAQKPNTSQTTPTATASTPATGMQLPELSPRDPFRPALSSTQPTPPETHKVVRSESPARPRREIAGNPPPVPPLTLPPNGQIGLQPAESAPPTEPEQPNYTVTGVVQGPNSVAIIADSDGRRRFVKQGDLLEEGWRVASIERGKVTLRKGKQQLSVRVGESTAPNGGDTQ